MRGDNASADVTLACEDDQQVEAPKVILAEQVLFNRLFHSHHHININVKCCEARKRQQLGVSGLASLALVLR